MGLLRGAHERQRPRGRPAAPPPWGRALPPRPGTCRHLGRGARTAGQLQRGPVLPSPHPTVQETAATPPRTDEAGNLVSALTGPSRPPTTQLLPTRGLGGPQYISPGALRLRPAGEGRLPHLIVPPAALAWFPSRGYRPFLAWKEQGTAPAREASPCLSRASPPRDGGPRRPRAWADLWGPHRAGEPRPARPAAGLCRRRPQGGRGTRPAACPPRPPRTWPGCRPTACAAAGPRPDAS